MEFSFENQQNSQSSLASDRLRKAIERNRAKQAKREVSGRAQRSWTAPGASSSPYNRSQSSSTRTGVATAENVEFSTPPRSRKSSTVTTQNNYLPAKTVKRRSSVKRKSRQSDNDFLRYLVIAAWVFISFLILRLIFSSGGIMDYYDSLARLEARDYLYHDLVRENDELAQQIQLIQDDRAYQRQLVRDHLGYIAHDEYLVIFSNNSQVPSL